MADETVTAPGVRDALITWFLAFVVSNIVGGIVLGATGHLGPHDPDPPLWLTASLAGAVLGRPRRRHGVLLTAQGHR